MQNIGKEVKIGLAVIGVLVTSFGYVLVKRLAHESQAAAAATAANDADHGPDAAKSPAHAGEKPTVLAGLDTARPAELTPEQKASPFGPPPSRRHEPGDGGAADPAASSGDSYMPADHRAPRELPDAHTDADTPHDHHAAPAAYGQPAYGDGSTAPGSTGQTPKDAGGYGGGPAFGPGGGPSGGPAFGPAAGHNDPQPLRTDSPAANAVATDPFQHHPAASLTPVENPALSSAGSPTPPPDAIDGGKNHRRDAARLDGIVSDPASPGSAPVAPSDNVRLDSPRPNSLQVTPARDMAMPAEPRRDESVAVATPTPTYVSPPASLQATNDSAMAPQQLVGDSTAHKGQYLVQPNDNFWTISEKVYGTGGYFKAIFEYNRSRHPQADRLQVGESLEVPDASILQKTYPDLCPKPGRGVAASHVVPASARMQPGTRVYTVEEGDTLFEVARRELGKPSRWGEIYQLNRDALGTDFDYLRPGSQLLIPADAGRGDPIAREPSATMTR